MIRASLAGEATPRSRFLAAGEPSSHPSGRTFEYLPEEERRELAGDGTVGDLARLGERAGAFAFLTFTFDILTFFDQRLRRNDRSVTTPHSESRDRRQRVLGFGLTIALSVLNSILPSATVQ